MKSFYVSIPIIFLFLIGCSRTYRVINYPSKEKFHNDANGSMKIRDVNVVTIDSSFTALEGTQIKDDSLYVITQIQEKKEKIPLKDTKEIKYFGKSYEEPSAIIFMKNGTELRRNNIKILPDSIIQCTYIQITNEYIPLTEVKQINYTNHWVGLGTGIIGGAIIGLTSSIVIGKTGWGETNPRGGIYFGNSLWGVIFGTVIGAFVGTIIGWDMIYLFNP